MVRVKLEKIKYAKIVCRANNNRKEMTTFHRKLSIRVN